MANWACSGISQDQLGSTLLQQTVLEVGIAREWKCEACLAGELIEFADGSFGRALNLEAQTVGAVRFASSFGEQTCMEGSLVRTTSQVEMIPGGDSYRGRIVNALGAPVDGLGEIDKGRTGIIVDR